MPDLTTDDVDLLEDLLADEDFDEADDVLELLYYTAEQQIREENPPEVRQTLVRLRRAGYTRSDIMEMIVHVMMHESVEAAHNNGQVNNSRYVSALSCLPDLECSRGAVSLNFCE